MVFKTRSYIRKATFPGGGTRGGSQTGLVSAKAQKNPTQSMQVVWFLLLPRQVKGQSEAGSGPLRSGPQPAGGKKTVLSKKEKSGKQNTSLLEKIKASWSLEPHTHMHTRRTVAQICNHTYKREREKTSFSVFDIDLIKLQIK